MKLKAHKLDASKLNLVTINTNKMAEETVGEAFGHPPIRWRKSNPMNFYSDELLKNAAKGIFSPTYPREDQE